MFKVCNLYSAICIIVMWYGSTVDEEICCCLFQTKEYLKDPSKFAVAAAPAAAAAAAPAAKKEEKKPEPESESDDDMGFGLFD